MSIKFTQANGGYSGADITSGEWSIAANNDDADVPRVQVDLSSWLTANSLTAADVLAVRYTTNKTTNPDPRETTGVGVEVMENIGGNIWATEDQSANSWWTVVFPPGSRNMPLSIAILTDSGWTTWSVDAKDTTLDARRPYAPNAPVVTGASSSSISVDWVELVPADGDDGGSAITQYDLRWSASSDMSSPTTVTDIADPETVGSLSASTTYYVQIRAVNAIGASDWSDIGSGATTAGSATAPSAFTVGQWALTDPVSDGDLQVEIDVLPDNGGSVITDLEYELDASGTWVSFGSAATGVYTISGLTNTTSYNVRIRAVNAVGNGAASDTKSATPTAPASGSVVNGIESLTSLTLNTSYTTGTYATGDPYIVLSSNQAVITATSPLATTQGSGRATNGLMVNYHNKAYYEGNFGTWPTAEFGYSTQGWDSDTNNTASATMGYNNSFNEDPVVLGGNLTITGEATVLKSVSKPSPTATGRPTLQSVEAYTFVTSAPPANTLRPGACADSKSTNLFTTADINLSYLPNVASLSGGSDYTRCLNAVKGWKMVGGHLNHDHNRFAYASDSHVQPYGQYTFGGSQLLSAAVCEVALECCTNKFTTEQKRTLFSHICQIGIDIIERYYQDNVSHNHFPAGALGLGLEMVAGLTAHMLDSTRLKTAVQDRAYWGDIKRHFYVSQSDVGRVVDDETYIQADADASMPEWGEQHTRQNNRDTRNSGNAVNNNYRHQNAGGNLPGVLLMHMVTGLKSTFGTDESVDAFLDYHDRFMERDFYPDSASNVTLAASRGSSVLGETSYGQTYMKAWTKSMWDTYRASYGTTVWNWP